MKVLVIGGGGREHALAWKLSQSASVEHVYCAPGNAGMDGVECIDTPIADLADFCESNDVGLTVVGPEAPLCDGIVDDFRARGLPVFGPDKKAAQLEGSKAFAKAFMNRHGIPTAAAASFNDADSAIAYIREQGAPIVIKADGLAAGKGVTVAETEADAIAGVKACFDGAFGEAGAEVLIEECMVGEEASIFAFVDHHTIRTLATSQDHKRIGEGDTGPNTGGMGAYSPAPVVDDVMAALINQRILQPFLAGCVADGLDYRGIIYVGIMATNEGPKVVEFNVRFGDPECQPVCMRMKSDLAEAMLATIENRLGDHKFEWTPEPAVCVVMASGGYPGNYDKGHSISGLDEAAANGAVVFHAGTAREGAAIVTAGGRVLGVTATGPDIKAAVDKAYAAVAEIEWKGAIYRRDIAYRAIARLE
jgi:phosphoribosylamine--glycine ligase